MKIGVYIGKNSPESGGGFTFEQSILGCLKNIHSKHEFIIFFDEELNKEFKKSFFQKVFNRLKTKKVQTSNLNKAVNKYKIELMWFLTPAYQFVDVPFIYTVWDLQHRLQPYFPEVSVTGSLFEDRENYYKNIIPRASFVVTGNDAGKEEIKLFYGVPDFRIKTIEFPTPDYVFSFDLHLLANLINKKYLFYPAQFWPHKNHIVILLAAKILKEKFNLDFDIVFTGSDKGNLNYIKEKTKELGLQNQTHFLGFVKTEELISLYKNAFALIFPSFFGPDNIPPLEAFALNCPVINADMSGMKLQLKDAALFFDPKDENELADIIKKLFEDENLRKELIQKGLEIAQNWTSKDYVNEIIKIIDGFEPIRRCWSNEIKYIHL